MFMYKIHYRIPSLGPGHPGQIDYVEAVDQNSATIYVLRLFPDARILNVTSMYSRPVTPSVTSNVVHVDFKTRKILKGA